MSDSISRGAKIKGWRRFFLYLTGLLLALLIIGFFVFVGQVSKPKLPSPIPQADGIVVWTGKGGGRLEAGANLLKNGHGERLLISGVNKSNDRDAVLNLLDLPKTLSDCCIDLDYAAEDTAGNARETAVWSEALGYEHIILVTSAYHMPRAETEIAAERGRIRITPYPVLAADTPVWWRSPEQAKRLIFEYGKLLLTYARHPNNNGQRGAPILPDIPQNTSP